MITNSLDPVEWAAFVTELDDAREHLDGLLTHLSESGEVEEDDGTGWDLYAPTALTS